MYSPQETRCWILNSKPTGSVVLDGDNPTFSLETTKLPSLGDNQLLVRTLYISNDPAQRTWIGDSIPGGRLYTKAVEVGEVMGARGIAEVIESTSSKFQKGDHVLLLARVGWTEYAVVGENDVAILDPLPRGLSETHYLGAFGGTGLTAYYGLVVQCEAKKGEKVVVSGAAGATGSMVVQIAKHLVGAGTVIGIAGSDEKCRWVEQLGADICLNYKSPSFAKDLEDATGASVNIYFDNVGGETLDRMLPLMAPHGRIAVCGAISNYNGEDIVPLRNWFQVIFLRLRIQGFAVLDYLSKAGEVKKILAQAVEDGKLRIDEGSETVVEAKFEDIPRVWLKLFDGQNKGKLITAL
ncbi:hypothetical protein BDV59DRAFT_196154 [Aspergillus ambiguus]|uniref:MDR family NADP-dependent oxidoreductase n=1 Tax=Aspergillus ambiguus TaxID=176160 RepID=UPI003CCD99EC